MKFLLPLALLMLAPSAPAPTPAAAARCSLRISPVKKFNDAEYVFTGSVVGPVSPAGSERSGEVWGLLVAVEEKIHAPAALGSRAEVFPFHINPGCGDEPLKREELARDFPAGARVRVIAVRSRAFKEPATEGAVALDAYLYGHGDLSPNELEGEAMTSASAVYDYASFRKPDWRSVESEAAQRSRWKLPAFELRKDLLRLREADSEGARVRILERLADYPNDHELDFGAVARPHVKDERTLAGLIKKREAVVARLRADP